MRRILVTGASGFLGKRLVPRLLAQGDSVRALLLPSERDPFSPAPGYQAARGDITRPETLTQAFSGVDSIIHLAGAVGYGQTLAACRRVNVDGTRNVVLAAERAGAKRFLHMSTVAVYGRVPETELDERSPTLAIGDPYGDTKIEAERIVERSALDWTILRPTVIYGPGDDKFLPKLVENLRTGRARVIGSGMNLVDLIHVDDVADLVALALNDRKAIRKRYNACGPGDLVWREFLPLVSRSLGIESPTRSVPYALAIAAAAVAEKIASIRGTEPRITRYAVRVVGRAYRYSGAKAGRELGYSPKRKLREEIPGCVRALARRG